jgi:hypothetical protein
MEPHYCNYAKLAWFTPLPCLVWAVEWISFGYAGEWIERCG